MTEQDRVSIAFVQTHLNQYAPPFFRHLQRDPRFNVRVIYVRPPTPRHDPELGTPPGWGEELLAGVKFEVVDGLSAYVNVLAGLRNYDAVFVDGWKNSTAWAGMYAARRRRVPVVIRTDSTAYYRATHGFRWRARSTVLRTLLAPAVGVAYVSAGARDHMRLVGFPDERLLRLPYTTDVSSFRAAAASARVGRETLRSNLGFAPTDLVAISVIKLNRREGVSTLLRGMASAVTAVPRLKLLLVGSGPLRPEVTQHSASNAITAIGYQPFAKLPSLYGVSDCFIHPAPEEPWGVSVVESLACGLPQILSDGVGAARELVVQGDNGFVFPAGDSDALCRTLIQWSKLDDGAQRSMRKRAAETVAPFEYPHIADELFAWASSRRVGIAVGPT